MNNFSNTKKITITGILVAISLIVSSLAIPLQLGGVTTMRITFASPFLITVALLFGPVYGGISYFANDIIMFMLKPTGPYMWEYALLIVLKGILVGCLYMFIKKINISIYEKLFLIFNSLLLLFGIVNLIKPIQVIEGYEQILWISYIILIIASVLNFGIYFILNSKYKHLLENYLKINFSIAIPYIMATIMATFIFKKYYGLTSETAFVILVPRIVEELFMVILYSVVCAIFLKIFNKYLNINIAK